MCGWGCVSTTRCSWAGLGRLVRPGDLVRGLKTSETMQMHAPRSRKRGSATWPMDANGESWPTFLAVEHLLMESNGHIIARWLMLLHVETFSYGNLKGWLQHRGPGTQDFKTIVWPKLKERWVWDSNGRFFQCLFLPAPVLSKRNLSRSCQLVCRLEPFFPGAQVSSDTIRKQKTLMEADPGDGEWWGWGLQRPPGRYPPVSIKRDKQFPELHGHFNEKVI